MRQYFTWHSASHFGVLHNRTTSLPITFNWIHTIGFVFIVQLGTGQVNIAYDNNYVSLLADSIHALLEEKSVDVDDLIEEFSNEADRIGTTENIARTFFFKAILQSNKKSESRYESAQDAIEYMKDHANDLLGAEWATYLMKLKLVQSQVNIIRSEKEEAAQFQYQLIASIDSLLRLYPNDNFEKFHILNYFNLSNTFLFDNDEISTRYADSAIVWSRRHADPKYLYSSYNIKYYSRYYSDDGPLLSSIADSCIKYATITKDERNKGEAFMHKCNALVVLGEATDGMTYCDRAVASYATLNDSSFLSSTLHNIGNVFKKADDNERALQYYKKALTYISAENEDEYYNTMEAIATELYEMGSYQEASEYYNDYSKGFYKFYTDQLASQFSEAEAKYQSERKEVEIARQQLIIEQQSNIRKLVIIGSIAVISLLSAVFFGLYQRSKRRRQEAEMAFQLQEQRTNDLEQLGKLKTDFFNNVSHELRTPLTLVIAPLEDALSEVRNIDVRGRLNLALSNSRRLLNITNEILDLSKLDESKVKVSWKDVALRSFLDRVFHSFDSLAKTKDIKLVSDLQIEEGLYMTTDQSKLEKILNNLISNSIKYSPRGAQVEMRVDESQLYQGQFIFEIIDQGIGIPESEQDKIFDRFFQSSESSHASGTGIGLALVKELVELLGGEIFVNSELGKGSTFRISLPITTILRDEEEQLAEQTDIIAEILPPILVSGKKPSILIVEDDLEMSKYLVSILGGDYIVDTAFNGLEAIERLQSVNYDLISSDIMMPQMDGFEFRAELNKNKQWKDTPFIMLSARVLEADKLKGFQLGIDDYITKPFSSAEFKARVYNLISNKISRTKADEIVDEIVNQKSEFLTRARKNVEQRLDDPGFKVAHLAEHLNYSSRQLSRILQKTTGMSAVAFILEIRLQHAYQYIKSKKYGTIKEVQYAIGIDSASYFSSKFKERFGVSPGSLQSDSK